MDDLLLSKAKELRQMIDDLPLVKEYYLLKDLIETDESLKELRQNIALTSKQGKLEESKNLKELYNSNPLVNNYNICKDEVVILLNEIKDILS